VPSAPPKQISDGTTEEKTYKDEGQSFDQNDKSSGENFGSSKETAPPQVDDS